MPRIKYHKRLILGIFIPILLTVELTAKPAMKSGYQRTCYEQKSIIEAVFMVSKKSTVAIKMLLTATREQLSFIFIQTRNCLKIWDHSTLGPDR